MKDRLDRLVLERGLAPSRERAQALILAGRVLVDEQKVEKPGAAIAEAAVLRILGEEQRYVSRGGFKLEAALVHWRIDLEAHPCMDVGASTGGFTDCMLQHGAASVFAVDTGYGQIADSLRRDPRVTLLERTNARYLKPGDLPPRIRFVSMDVSFISATLVLPGVMAALQAEPAPGLAAVVLVKPQFEAGRAPGRKRWHRARPGRPPVCDRARAHRSGSARSPRYRPHGFADTRYQGQSGVPAVRHLLTSGLPQWSSRTLKLPCVPLPSSPSRRRKSFPPCCQSWSRGCGSMISNPSSIT